MRLAEQKGEGRRERGEGTEGRVSNRTDRPTAAIEFASNSVNHIAPVIFSSRSRGF